MSIESQDTVDVRPSEPAPSEAMKVIQLDMTARGSSYVLRWTTPDPKDPEKRKSWAKYAIEQAKLKQGSQDIRAAFEEFAASIVDQYRDEALDSLERLAEAGASLYEILMTPDDEEDDVGFRDWFEETVVNLSGDAASDGYALEMVLNSTARDFMPPLGLVFSPRPGRQKSVSMSFDDFRDFWCISLRCACFTDIQLKNPMPQPIDGENFDAVIVRERMDSSYLLVEKIVKQNNKSFSIEAKQKMAGLSLKTKLAEAFVNKGVLFHFDLEASHPTSEELKFPYDEDNLKMLAPQDFQRIMRDAKVFSQSKHYKARSYTESPAYALAVIDREAIIRGDRGTGWLDIFFSTPWTGLIAVEGDVQSRKSWDEEKEIRPDRFLGLIFLKSILQHKGRRLIDSIVEARRECWPFSMFFGIYCNPQQPWIKSKPALVDDIDDILPMLGEHHPAYEMVRTKTADT